MSIHFQDLQRFPHILGLKFNLFMMVRRILHASLHSLSMPHNSCIQLLLSHKAHHVQRQAAWAVWNILGADNPSSFRVEVLFLNPCPTGQGPKDINHVFSCNGWTIQYAMVDHKGLFVVSHDRKSGIASMIQRASIVPLHHSQVIGLSFWPGSPDGVKMLTAARQGAALCHVLGTKQTFPEASYGIFLNTLLARIMSPAHAAASHMAQEMRPCGIL